MYNPFGDTTGYCWICHPYQNKCGYSRIISNSYNSDLLWTRMLNSLPNRVSSNNRSIKWQFLNLGIHFWCSLDSYNRFWFEVAINDFYHCPYRFHLDRQYSLLHHKNWSKKKSFWRNSQWFFHKINTDLERSQQDYWNGECRSRNKVGRREW